MLVSQRDKQGAQMINLAITMKKRDKTQINDIRYKRGEMTADTSNALYCE